MLKALHLKKVYHAGEITQEVIKDFSLEIKVVEKIEDVLKEALL